MRNYTRKEIFDKVLDIFERNHEESWTMGFEMDGSFITIEKNDPDEVIIKIEAMYEVPKLSFEFLIELSNFFETTKINDLKNEWANTGCDTCDYSSSYGYYIKISDDKVKS